MRIRLGIVAALLITPFPARPQSSFTVGTATAAPGQKATGYLEVPAGVDAATSIPVVVVNGAKPGKVLALVSGAHGTDLAESLSPYPYWDPPGPDAPDRTGKEMVLAFGLDHIIIWRERPTDPA